MYVSCIICDGTELVLITMVSFFLCSRLGNESFVLNFQFWNAYLQSVVFTVFRTPCSSSEHVISELRGVTCHVGSHSVYLPPDTSEHTPP